MAFGFLKITWLSFVPFNRERRLNRHVFQRRNVTVSGGSIRWWVFPDEKLRAVCGASSLYVCLILLIRIHNKHTDAANQFKTVEKTRHVQKLLVYYRTWTHLFQQYRDYKSKVYICVQRSVQLLCWCNNKWKAYRSYFRLATISQKTNLYSSSLRCEIVLVLIYTASTVYTLKKGETLSHCRRCTVMTWWNKKFPIYCAINLCGIVCFPIIWM